MVYTRDLKSLGRKSVRVQVPPEVLLGTILASRPYRFIPTAFGTTRVLNFLAAVYILYSKIADRYYVGYTKSLATRLDYHHIKEFPNSYTAKYADWELYFLIENLQPGVAVKIERHIKRMKSRIFLQNLKKYPEISEKLRAMYG